MGFLRETKYTVLKKILRLDRWDKSQLSVICSFFANCQKLRPETKIRIPKVNLRVPRRFPQCEYTALLHSATLFEKNILEKKAVVPLFENQYHQERYKWLPVTWKTQTNKPHPFVYFRVCMCRPTCECVRHPSPRNLCTLSLVKHPEAL